MDFISPKILISLNSPIYLLSLLTFPVNPNNFYSNMESPFQLQHQNLYCSIMCHSLETLQHVILLKRSRFMENYRVPVIVKRKSWWHERYLKCWWTKLLWKAWILICPSFMTYNWLPILAQRIAWKIFQPYVQLCAIR